jgi:hypothetical protein
VGQASPGISTAGAVRTTDQGPFSTIVDFSTDLVDNPR